MLRVSISRYIIRKRMQPHALTYDVPANLHMLRVSIRSRMRLHALTYDVPANFLSAKVSAAASSVRMRTLPAADARLESAETLTYEAAYAYA